MNFAHHNDPVSSKNRLIEGGMEVANAAANDADAAACGTAFVSGVIRRPGTVAALNAALVAALCLAGCDSGNKPAVGAAVAGTSSGASLGDARTGRFVKLEEVTEWNGKAWAAVAEFNLIDATGATMDRTGWTAAADSSTVNDVPQHAIDGDPASLWHTPWDGEAPPPPHALTIDLGAPARISGFRYLARQDKLVNGTIAQYRFYISSDGVNWGEPVASGDFTNMSAPTTEKVVIFANQTENRPPVAQTPDAQSTPMGNAVSLHIHATDPDGDPLVYTSSGLPVGLSIASKTGVVSGTPIVPGRSAVSVTVSDNKGATAKLAFDWTVMPPAIGATPSGAGEVRFVRFEEVSEINGKPWASVAEFNLIDAKGVNLPRTGWSASADSADGNDKPGNAIDGNSATLWHSQWDSASPVPPHSLIVDLGRPVTVTGFRYLPRQDKLTNGMIAKFRFFTSNDGVAWGEPRAEGDFSMMGDANAEKTVILK